MTVMNPCQKITSNHPFDWYPTWQRSCGIFRDLGDRTAEAMQQRAANFSSLFVEVDPSSIAVSLSRRVWGWNLPLLSNSKSQKCGWLCFFPAGQPDQTHPIAGGIVTSSRRSTAGGLVYSQGSWESKIRCLNSFLFLDGGGGGFKYF